MVWGNSVPPPRRLSNSSVTSSRSSTSSSSPVLSAVDSSSALILVHDQEDTSTPFDFPSDDDDDDNDGNERAPQFEVRRASNPPLMPATVFIYLLVPYLKLGAMFLPHTSLSIKYGLPPLLVFGVLAAFSRQVLYRLARYMRTADLEDVALDAFARGRNKERRRNVVRGMIRAATGSLRILLATVYLRESVHVLLPILPEATSLPTQPILTIVLALLVSPLSFAQSLASKRIMYAAWLSLATYIIWLGCIAYAHSKDHLPDGLQMGTLWQGITTIAFAFTSSSTLSLYASLRGTAQPISTTKPSKFRSFKTLSTLSVAIAMLLTAPLIIFFANPNASSKFSPAPPQLGTVIAVFSALTLLLSIPTVIATSPPLPIPERIRHATTIQISKTLLSILYVALALLPAWAYRALTDILLVLALTSTYFLPALIHVTEHFFKRPIAIVVPQNAGTSHQQQGSIAPESPRADELLLRKERALQRRRFRRRIVWDVGVWVLFVGSGAGGVWAVGRVIDAW